MFKELMEYTKTLCGPSYIYFVFASWSFVFLVVRMLTSGKFELSKVILKLAVSYVVIFALNWFCSKGWENFSWFLLYWMFAFVLIMLIGTFVVLNKMIDKTNVKCVNLNQN